MYVQWNITLIFIVGLRLNNELISTFFIRLCAVIVRLTTESSAFWIIWMLNNTNVQIIKKNVECRYQNSPELLLCPMLHLKYYVLVQMSSSLPPVISSQAESFLGRSQVNNSPRRPSSQRCKSSYRFSNTSHSKPSLCVMVVILLRDYFFKT